MNTLKNKLLEMKKVTRDPILLTSIILVIISLILFIIWPLFDILKESFISNEGKLTLNYYMDTLSKSENKRILMNTMVLGLFVSTVATSVAFLFAYADAYIKLKFKKLFNIVSILPIISPPFSLAMSFIMLFGQRGIVTHKILGIESANVYGFKGLATVQILTFFPVAYLLLLGILKQIDPSLEEAARNMGASRGQVFRTVILPLVKPGIVNAFLLVFIQSVADFGNAMVIGGNFTTLSAQVYIQSMGNYDLKGGTALASVLLTISILMFVVQKYWLNSKSYVTVTGKPSRQRNLIEDKYIKIPIQIGCMLISLFIIILYGMIPIGSFVKVWGIDYTPTLMHYKYIVELGLKFIRDTTILALIAMPITGVLGMIIAFLITRKKFIGRSMIEFASMLAMAIPGTVIGMGYVLAYNKYPLMLTGTATIIILSFIFRSMPVGIRSGIVSLQQIDPAIEEAAQDLGANTYKVFTSVTIPLIKNAFFSGLVYSFVRSMTALSAVIFLVSARYNLLTVEIMSQVDVGRIGVAAGYSTILIVIVVVVVSAMKFILSKLGVNTKEIAG
ncbi:sulfate transport system permease protein CysW [Clostridium tepidiprofundi DSM 19306]|uniref:Sulfate transport system permease protein CysW n=1 Tax=Clostridium tepidiprofundi DSM 19306 TaxID=1121338 RepID=A0A151B239_9CLOT|nr:iron ABC transporter permease [Clostridium tepidiprofundi]KYH33981.1 sulfate transport system permease protein CysW [Clostridium tepidiprofundi DSM 19306]